MLTTSIYPIPITVKHTTVSARFKQPLFSAEQQPLTTSNTKFENDLRVKKEVKGRRLSLKDYFQESKEMLMKSDGGPPRWFSPLECGGARLKNAPLLLSLPGVDGTGLSLLLHHARLAEIFDIWCLHIPTMDRTSFTDLVKLVEDTIRSENDNFPDRPIYLVGESVGGCLALAAAARTPDIDLVLLLANPATSFGKSQLQPLVPILKIIPGFIRPGLPYLMSLMTGLPSKIVTSTAEKGVPSQQTVTNLSETAAALFSYLSDLGDVLTIEMVLWKLKMLESACEYSNSCLRSVSAQTLILSRSAVSNYLKEAGDAHGTVKIQISIGDGPGTGTAWGCDLSYDYVKINAEYTT